MNRRLVLVRSMQAAVALLTDTRFAFAAPDLADPREFSVDLLRRRAKQLASRSYSAPQDQMPKALEELTYDQYHDIRFKADEALWRGQSPYTVQFFHPGFYYKTPVRIFEVDGNQSRELRYRPALFDFGTNQIDPATFGERLGFAGFRVHTSLNDARGLDELIAFLGASYFRALGRHMNYGLSARGLAIATASEDGEEFPYFSEFYLDKPEDANSLVIYALLNSQSVTGVYTFTIRPGEETVVDVAMSLYARVAIDKIGIAPLTSMFFFAGNDRVGVDDFRPEVHDSDGLMIWNGSGEWLWRPLVNPQHLRISTFVDRNPKGFGLMQRNRDFRDFQDLDARYETRPSVWVEPVGDWGAGGVMLFEIPSDQESNDNIVAFWRPEEPIPAGAEWQGSYRLHWCRNIEAIAERPASVVATRVGEGPVDGSRRFVVEFMGGRLPRTASATPEAKVWSGSAQPQHVACRYDEYTGAWRVSFFIVPTDESPVELRCHLALSDEAVTETWMYQWTE